MHNGRNRLCPDRVISILGHLVLNRGYRGAKESGPRDSDVSKPARQPMPILGSGRTSK